MEPAEIAADPLRVYAERFNTLILDKKAFRNPIPGIQGLAPKTNMKAWVDRKLFIHNLGHATAAYCGFTFYPDKKYLSEVLQDEIVLESTRTAMRQSGMALYKEYPEEFTWNELTDHIDDLLARFRNKALRDTVYRIGKDLNRKLGPNDRFIGAIRMAKKHNLPYDKIANALSFGFHFRGTDHLGDMTPGDGEFAHLFRISGVEKILTDVCGLDPLREKEIIEAVLQANREPGAEKIVKNNK